MTYSTSSSSSPISANIVDDIEKRINTEINQLVNDIQRIEPQGESWCTFGKLFTDTAVEQYYEALVNTLKSAKRRGIVAFKGQFLLKGMHDHVIVSVVTNNDSKKKDVNVAAKERTRETINNKTQKKHQHFHYREFSSTEEKQLDDNHSKQETEDDGHYQHPRRSHDLNQNAFPVSPTYSQHSLHSIQQQQQQQQHDSSSATVQADLDHSIKDTDILVRESSQPTMMKMISPLESSNHDLNDDVCHQRQSQQYTGESYNHYHHQSTTLKSSPSPSSYPVSNLETKLEKLLHSSSSSSPTTSPTTSTKQKQSSCNSPVTSFASAPVCSSTSSNHTNNVNSDVSHMQSSGTTSHSSSYNAPESHQNRVEREIHQLIKDIKRIEPSDKSFCLFGVLFDDPDVEQYYEALVGTLKAARKKGAITFQGQMLLKGMHDNVQISVVE